MSYRIMANEAHGSERQQQGWVRLRLPEELGECHTDCLGIAPDFSLLRTHYRPQRDLVEESRKQLERPVLAITLGLTGESQFRGHCGTELSFRSGHTTVSSFLSSHGERHYRHDHSVRQIRLLVGERMLRHYLPDDHGCRKLLDSRSGVRQLAYRPTSPACLAHANALLWQASEPAPDILQTHIHVLSLLAEQLRHLDLSQDRHTPRLRQRDADKLDEARRLLEMHNGHYMGISDLAAAVGLSESKLRSGFRHRFRQSPLRLQLELRMRKAWVLLETGRQVAEVAYEVGYEHPSNFSAAFARFYGRAPKSVFGPKR